jgi:hypothetical protein
MYTRIPALGRNRSRPREFASGSLSIVWYELRANSWKNGSGESCPLFNFESKGKSM